MSGPTRPSGGIFREPGFGVTLPCGCAFARDGTWAARCEPAQRRDADHLERLVEELGRTVATLRVDLVQKMRVPGGPRPPPGPAPLAPPEEPTASRGSEA